MEADWKLCGRRGPQAECRRTVRTCREREEGWRSPQQNHPYKKSQREKRVTCTDPEVCHHEGQEVWRKLEMYVGSWEEMQSGAKWSKTLEAEGQNSEIYSIGQGFPKCLSLLL